MPPKRKKVAASSESGSDNDNEGKQSPPATVAARAAKSRAKEKQMQLETMSKLRGLFILETHASFPSIKVARTPTANSTTPSPPNTLVEALDEMLRHGGDARCKILNYDYLLAAGLTKHQPCLDNLTTTKNVLSGDALFAMINANEVAAIHTERDCVNGVHSIESIGQLFACMVNRQFEKEINTINAEAHDEHQFTYPFFAVTKDTTFKACVMNNRKSGLFSELVSLVTSLQENSGNIANFLWAPSFVQAKPIRIWPEPRTSRESLILSDH